MNKSDHDRERRRRNRVKLLGKHPNCEICGVKLTIETMTVDHDPKIHNHPRIRKGHATVRRGCKLCERGILCGRCNMILGHYEQSIDFEHFVAMQQYIMREEVEKLSKQEVPNGN